MDSKKSCVCCGNRLTAYNRRPLMDKDIRLFVGTRLFPSHLPNNSHICSICRSMYNKWKVLPEFHDILTTIDVDQRTNDTTANDISGDDDYMDEENGSTSEVVSDDEYMDEENCSAQPVNETSSDNESIDEATGDGGSVDEERSIDKSSEADDLIATDDNDDEQKIDILTEVAISSNRIQMIPSTKTTHEEDRNKMFVRRHISIPVGSRCCHDHIVDDRLPREASLSLTSFKEENQSISRQNIMNILQSYRGIVNSNKHLDFDDCLSLTDTDYMKLTDFTRVQHTQILSCILATALKNSVTRSARSVLACLLMKSKLGLRPPPSKTDVSPDTSKLADILGICWASSEEAMIKFLAP